MGTRKFIPAFLSWVDDSGKAQNLYFDLCMSYGAEHASEVTTHPVEQGADIADHVRVKPLKIKLDVFVSNTPIDDLPDGSRSKTFGPVTVNYPNAQGALIGPGQVNSYLFGGQVTDYILNTYLQLVTLHNLHQLLDVTTPITPYHNLVITDINFVRDDQTSGEGAKFVLELEQITIVTSDIVSSVTIPQAQPTATIGQTEAETPDDQGAPRQSVLSWLGSGAGL